MYVSFKPAVIFFFLSLIGSGTLVLFLSSFYFCSPEQIILQIYLKFEQSSGDPSRVQVLYERAVTDFPIASDLWLDYTRYLDKTLKVCPLDLLVCLSLVQVLIQSCVLRFRRLAISLERFIPGQQRIVPGLGSFGFNICYAWNAHVLRRKN